MKKMNEINDNLDISSLDSHVLVTGTYGIGGKRMIRSLAERVRNELNVPTIIVSLSNDLIKKKYSWDHCFTPEMLNVPHLLRGQDLLEAASTLSTSFGLGNRMGFIIHDFMKKSEFPSNLIPILNKVAAFLKKTREVSEEEYYGIVTMILELVERKKSISGSGPFRNGTMKWLKAWNSNETIFLDLTRAAPDIKLYVLLQMFQIINLTTPEDLSRSHPRGFIFIEEPVYDFLTPKSNLLGLDDLTLEHKITSIFDNLEKKGIFFVVEEDSPDDLFPSLIERFSVKIFFRIWYPQNSVFHFSDEERRVIETLPNFRSVTFRRERGRIT